MNAPLLLVVAFVAPLVLAGNINRGYGGECVIVHRVSGVRKHWTVTGAEFWRFRVII